MLPNLNAFFTFNGRPISSLNVQLHNNLLLSSSQTQTLSARNSLSLALCSFDFNQHDMAFRKTKVSRAFVIWPIIPLFTFTVLTTKVFPKCTQLIPLALHLHAKSHVPSEAHLLFSILAIGLRSSWETSESQPLPTILSTWSTGSLEALMRSSWLLKPGDAPKNYT